MLEYSVSQKEKHSGEPNGDAFFVSTAAPALVALADGLGAGPQALEASTAAIAVVRECSQCRALCKNALPRMLKRCHKELKASRGAAVAVVLINPDRTLCFCGVGNIRLIVSGPEKRHVFSEPGIVGSNIPEQLKTSVIPFPATSLGFLFSDGVQPESVVFYSKVDLPLSEKAERIVHASSNPDDRTAIVFGVKEESETSGKTLKDYADCCREYFSGTAEANISSVMALARSLVDSSVNPHELTVTSLEVFAQCQESREEAAAAERLLELTRETANLNAAYFSACDGLRQSLKQFGERLRGCEEVKKYVAEIEFLVQKVAEINEFLDAEVFQMAVYKDQAATLQQISHAVLQSADFGVIVLDADANITIINAAALRILGIPERMAGKNKKDLLAECPEEMALFLERALARETLDMEKVRVKLGGQEVTLAIRTSTLHSGKGRAEGTVFIFHDISRREEEQKMLEESVRLAAIGQIAAGVAHEIKNPLTIIKGFSQLLNQRQDIPHLKKYLQTILEEVERANNFIQDFLEFGKPREPQVEAVNVNDLVLKTIALVDSHCFLQGIEIATELGPLPKVSADPVQIKQVLLNLLKNASEAMEENSCKKSLRVSTSADRVKGEVLVCISDNGCGIPPELMEKIATPFFTTKRFGTGLGISISRRIITRHGGKMDIVSDTSGTTVTVSLPL